MNPPRIEIPGTWGRATILLPTLVMVLGAPLQDIQKVPTLEDTVHRLTHVNVSLQTFQVEQDVDVRWLLFRFRLLSTVYAARPAKYKVIVHNPPWFLRRFGTVFTQAGRPEDVLTNYMARKTAWRDEGGRRLLYLDLAKLHAGVNPPSLEALVDPSRWLVERLTLHYEWGDVVADYHYQLLGGFLLPSAISVHTPNYPIACTLTYRDYRLNVTFPDAIFESPQGMLSDPKTPRRTVDEVENATRSILSTWSTSRELG